MPVMSSKSSPQSYTTVFPTSAAVGVKEQVPMTASLMDLRISSTTLWPWLPASIGTSAEIVKRL